MTDKPHNGQITNWWLHYPLSEFEPPEGALGYIVRGDLIDHPDFDPRFSNGHTSWVLSHNEATGEIETLNSRYRLVGKPKRAPTDARTVEGQP